ncbi:MAG: CusA/CzcA family heavy metal efflux RND transporter [Sorangiineae bacterium]|nr:CusA/CzcA family heavy metal efflux RND transporter [Polyangiaceae bacterium]MEB2322944.1 CusA/CzcA family heavy metal efflux RND transporter [Sorangiineae bacterium]
MLEGLLRYSLKNRLAAFLFALILAVAGWFAYRELTIEAFPDPTDTQVQVITTFDGQPTEEVERRVSIPLERALNGIPHLFRLRSISLFGLSFVTLTFDDDIEPQLARQLVLERLRDAELPSGITPELGPMATPIGEVYRYTLEGQGADPMTLRTLQDWVVRPQLLRVPGVADVVSYGGLVREIHVIPDPAKMATLGVGLEDVFGALNKASSNATGGYVQRGSEMFVIRSVGIFRNIEDIGQTRVAEHAGVPVLLKDVASIGDGYAPRQGIVTRDSNEDAVEGIVLMRRGENPSVVLEALGQRIKELDGRILPKNIQISPFYDRSKLVESTLHTVFHNLAEGALLVTLVLFAFTLSIRASLIVATVIPLSLAAAFAYLRARGMSANLLSMGAIDFGIIVDGAVILVEHLFHRVPRSDPGRPIAERIFDAAREVARPTLFSLLIIIAAYIPIFSMQRVEGRIFAPMANTVVSALVGALLVSFTLVPVLALFALRKGGPERESPLLRWARNAYAPALRFAMLRPALVLVVAAGALTSSLVLAPRLGSEFLPELNEGALYVTFTLPGNISLSEGRKLTKRIRERLLRTPELDGIMSQLGRPEDGTDPTLPNNLEFFVKLKPMNEWRKDKHTLDELTAEMTTNLEEIPGLEYNFSQPIRDNVAENISGQFGQVALKIYGDDLGRLQRTAEAAKDTIATVPGVADLGIVKSGESPQIAIKIDRAALARFNLDLEDVQDYIETALAGHAASELWEGEKRFDVTVRLPRVTRDDVRAIRSIRLPLKDGNMVPLSAIAQVEMGLGRAAITRENGQRYIGVRMNVRDRDMGSFVRDAQERVDAALDLPPGYHVVWGGEFENQQRAMKRLQVVIPLALLITFVLLFSAFQSVWDAAIILLHVPFAMVGGVAALAVAGMTLSIAAAVGFIALLGQAVLNGVLVVAAIKARLEAGQRPFEAVFEGAKERLRAILMTALLASLGLLPAALSHAIGSETQRPIAVVVVGGTISAALLTLIVLPVSYFWGHQLREWIRQRREARLAEPVG